MVKCTKFANFEKTVACTSYVNWYKFNGSDTQSHLDLFKHVIISFSCSVFAYKITYKRIAYILICAIIDGVINMIITRRILAEDKRFADNDVIVLGACELHLQNLNNCYSSYSLIAAVEHTF